MTKQAQAPQAAQESPKKDTPFYMSVVNHIDKAIEDGTLAGIQKKEVSIYIGYYKDGNKICGINKSKNYKFFAFHPEARQLKIDNLTPVSDKEAKQKHYGKVTAIYTGASLEVPVQILKMHLK